MKNWDLRRNRYQKRRYTKTCSCGAVIDVCEWFRVVQSGRAYGKEKVMERFYNYTCDCEESKRQKEMRQEIDKYDRTHYRSTEVKSIR